MYHSLRNKDLSIWLPFATHMSAIPGQSGMSLPTSNYWNMFQLVKMYGNVVSLDFGIMSSVIVSGLPLIKEAFTHQEENFMGRPKFPLHNLVFNENGKTFICCQICIVILRYIKGSYMPYVSITLISQYLHEMPSLMGTGTTLLEWKHSEDDL